jgi:hypothetical protein
MGWIFNILNVKYQTKTFLSFGEIPNAKCVSAVVWLNMWVDVQHAVMNFVNMCDSLFIYLLAYFEYHIYCLQSLCIWTKEVEHEGCFNKYNSIQ